MADKKKPKKMSLSDFNKQVGGAPNDEQIALPTAPRRGEEDGQEPNAWGGTRSFRGRDREAPSYFERSSRFGDSSFGGERASTGEEPRRSWNDREERPGSPPERRREFSSGSRDFPDREPREYDRRGPPRMDRDTGPRFRGEREPTTDAPRAITEDYPPLNDKERPKLNILKKGEEPENPLPRSEPKVDKPRKAKPDPFGGAKPREEVIKEKGLTDLDKEVEKKLAEKPKIEEVQGTLEKLEVNDKPLAETDKEAPQENESRTRHYSPTRRRSPPSRDRSYSDRGGRYNDRDREPRSYRDSGDRGGRRYSPPRDRNFGGERRNYNEPRNYGDRGGNRNFDGDRGGNRNFSGDRSYGDREPRSYRDSGDRGGRRYSPSRDRGAREYRGGGGRYRDNGGDRGRNYSSNRGGHYNDGGAPRSNSPPGRGGSESPSKNENTFESLPKRQDEDD